MKTHRSIAALAATLSLAAVGAGCGGDPIVGRWRSMDINTVASYSSVTDLDFQGGGYLNIVITESYTTTATRYPNCTEVRTTTQAGWESMGSGNSRNIALNGGGVCRVVRTGCSAMGDNQADAPCPAAQIGLGSQMGTYSVASDTLTLMLGGQTITARRQ